MTELLCRLTNKTEGYQREILTICRTFGVGWEIQLEIQNSSFYSESSLCTRNIFVNSV